MQIKLVKRKEFTATTFYPKNKIFMVYIASIASLDVIRLS